MWRSILLCLAVARMAGSSPAAEVRPSEGILAYEKAEIIPAFELEGKPTRIHTQGLYVTDEFYYMTGRLDHEPKQPLLLRLDRPTRRGVESINLAAIQGLAKKELDGLDHPSGFDFDGHSFWIALAESRPESRSVIVRASCPARRPFNETSVEAVFTVKDHIGSLAVDRAANRLYGANWDTKRVYIWDTSGRLIRSVSAANLNHSRGAWFPAVQDWKSIGPGRVLAGGLDKAAASDSPTGRSVIQLWNIETLTRLSSMRPPRPSRFAGELANEGCAVWKGRIYLLPDDLGPPAAIQVFRWEIPPADLEP